MLLRTFLLYFFVTTCLITAAEPTGTLAGTVLDPSGAAVAGAKVTLVNTQTNQSRAIQSEPDGSFVFPLAPVGDYRLTVEAGGFRRYEQTGIQLKADQSATVPIKLQIGATTESVEVTSNAQMIETRSAALNEVVNQQKIVELPLNGRNAAALVLLAPGAVDLNAGNAGGSGDTVQTVTYPSSISVSANGGRADTVNYNLDGGSNQDTIPMSITHSPIRMRWRSSVSRPIASVRDTGGIRSHCQRGY